MSIISKPVKPTKSICCGRLLPPTFDKPTTKCGMGNVARKEGEPLVEAHGKNRRISERVFISIKINAGLAFTFAELDRTEAFKK